MSRRSKGIAVALLAAFFVSSDALVASAGPRTIQGAWILVDHVVPGCEGPACEVAIGRAPLPGHGRIVRRVEVQRALDAAGLDAKTLSIPFKKRVLRPARQVSAKEFGARLREEVLRVLPEDTVLEDLGQVNKISVPVSGYTIRARWPGEKVFRRRVSIPIDLISDEVPFRRMQVAAKLSLQTRLPVAKKDLATGIVVSKNDVEWALLKLNAPPRNLASSFAQVVGHRLGRPRARGGTFETRHLERIPIVLRNQTVTVESTIGRIRVTVNGLARQDGAIGDRIRITLPAQSRLLWAEVTGPGTARVSQ